jgi:hypothetical protein
VDRIQCRLDAGLWLVSSLTHVTDETLLKLYENVRSQVSADIRLGDRYRLLGDTARKYADNLFEEIQRRGLQVSPIYWP